MGSKKKDSSASTRSLFERFKKLFSHKSRIQKDVEKMEKLSGAEVQREKLKTKLFSKTQTKKKKKREHATLQKLLTKAGLSISAQRFKKLIFEISIIISTIIALIVVVIGNLSGRSAVDLLIFMAGFWTAGFALVLILISIIASAYLDILIHNRRKQVEDVLADYLQLVAANIGAGMTVDKALWYAVRPRFGVLAKEIEDVAKRVVTGEDLPEALRRFSNQYDSPVLKRSINLLLEGIAAGGRIADLLHKISNDIIEQKILRQEMAANVTTYVIFISFAAILAAPVLFGLATQLLVVIQSITSTIPTTGGSTGLSVTPDVISLTDFKIFSSVLLTATAIMSALIISVIRRGSAFEGLRYIPAFIFTSLLLYFLSTFFFGGLFGQFF